MNIRSNDELHTKKCVPCAGGTPPLPEKEIQVLQKSLSPAWMVIDNHHLERRFKTPNFIDALTIANEIGTLAEQEGHHPIIEISWGYCLVKIWTHKINGLTESDFILAAKIDYLMK